ncbi:MAG: SPASM domain-containing protein [bacterium]|nr:SPASM domain-containing protein [bacterium]
MAGSAEARSAPPSALERAPATADTWKALKSKVAKNPGLGTVHTGSVPRRFAVTNLDFDVTENCNLGCLYCFKGEMYTQNMSIETMKRALDWLLLTSGDAKTVNCNFMGGEPTMRFKQIREFVPWARRRGKAMGKLVTFSMTTNLTLFTQDMRDFIDEYGFGLLMSIDGSPDVQDGSRPAKNGKLYSEIVEQWAKSMLRTRPRSTARATLHPDYVSTLAGSARYLQSIGFQVMAVSASEYEDWTPELFEKLEKQFEEIVDFVMEVYLGGGRFNVASFEYYINKLIRFRKAGTPEQIEVKFHPCGAGRGYMMVDYTGDVWPCHRFDGADNAADADGQFRLGNIFEDGFNHELQTAFVDFNHMEVHKEACSTCPVNEVCGGYCPAANLSDTGSIYTPHDTFCQWTWMVYRHAENLYDRMKAADTATFERMMSDLSDTETSGEK